jgi:alpha-mannosidase
VCGEIPLQHKRMIEQKIVQQLELIKSRVYQQRLPQPHFRYKAGNQSLLSPKTNDGDWPIIAPGTYWGKPRQDFILRTTFAVPDDWQAPVVLFLPIGKGQDFIHPEALAYIDGIAFQGINAFSQEILLRPCWCDGEKYFLALSGWCGVESGPFLMGQPEIMKIHQPTRNFVASVRVALSVLSELDENDPIYICLKNALEKAWQCLDFRSYFDESIYDRIEDAQRVLDESVMDAGSSLPIKIIATGHAHIDIAWLWTINQTKHKAARTFCNVLRLMEQFPNFHFTQSQPQLYKFIVEDHPEVFRQIQDRVKDGRWEITGGMWVEADCNLTGAESLVRQLILGRNFFKSHFSKAETPILWLPDTFGFPWTLPQLIDQAGLNYFITTKLSWNKYNRFPYDSFLWQGLDGTKVITHFVTTPDVGDSPYHTYNADLDPKRIFGTWRNYQHKEIHKELITLFGWGDGGGGPTREMLENSQRLANHPGVPRVRQGSALEFFQNLEATAGDKLPVWNGELYLEYHRGTYTTQAHIKRANRKSEFLLHDVEFLATWATLTDDFEYPHTELKHAWELLCLNQFHDILPGTSIAQVYEDSDQDYSDLRSICKQVKDKAIAAITQSMSKEASFVVINPTSFEGHHFCFLNEKMTEGNSLFNLISGDLLTTQSVRNGTLVEIPNISSYGLIALGIKETPLPHIEQALSAKHTKDVFVLENNFLVVEFNKSGEMIRLFDKSEEREVLPVDMKANIFQAFEDHVFNGDAWNIDVLYESNQYMTKSAYSQTIIETGPLRAGLEFKRHFLNSEIIQRIYLYRECMRLDFDTWVDWHERHVLLKVAFPIEVLSPKSTYEIQWGNIQRPTHRNTSWDQARFEVCAHKWVDLSEGGYGVSLLNDCKYGHDIRDNVIRLSLLRGTTYPDPSCDLGEHRFTYAIFPHSGSWDERTVQEAYAINDPLIIEQVKDIRDHRKNNAQIALASFFIRSEQSNVVIETIKQAEDGLGIIIRLYEFQGKRCVVTLHTGFSLDEVWATNILEENQEFLDTLEFSVSIFVKPYQILTLRMIPQEKDEKR